MKKRLVWNGLLIGLFVLFLVPIAYAVDINAINAAIQANGGGWFAKETPLSHLTTEQMAGWTGALAPEPSQVIENGKPFSGITSAPGQLPSALDWTNNGGNFVTGIRNQGGCGSCWAFASTAALEAKALITFNTPNQNLDLSEQIVLSCTGAKDSCNSGYMEDAANFIQNSGTSLEKCYPYTQTNGNCSSACANWQDSAYKIDGWSHVYNWWSPDINALKNAIQTYGPVVIWMIVYQDFQSYGGGIYKYSWGTSPGNHFVLVTGWDDKKGAFHVKNSWGTNWGENGFFWIAYSEFGMSSKTQFGGGAMSFGNAVHTTPCDLAVEFLVSVSGKEIDDGNSTLNFNDPSFILDICTNANGSATTDTFTADLFNGAGTFYWGATGVAVWNASSGATSATLQGANFDTDYGMASYLDVTIKYTPKTGKFTLTGKGGCDWPSAIQQYSIKGTGYESSGVAADTKRKRLRSLGKGKIN